MDNAVIKHAIRSNYTGKILFEAKMPWETPPRLYTRTALLRAVQNGTDLYDADLYEADLSNTNLSGARLRGADMYAAKMNNVNLSGADMTDADMRGATMYGADLSGADLRRANLSGAVMHNTDLRNTDLTGADLRGTNLSEANLRGSNLLDIGVDSRGYYWFVRPGTPPMIKAGCRWFTFAAAEEHWRAAHADNQDIRDECLARLAACKASAKAVGWI